jgi:hypothetical protein
MRNIRENDDDHDDDQVISGKDKQPKSVFGSPFSLPRHGVHSFPKQACIRYSHTINMLAVLPSEQRKTVLRVVNLSKWLFAPYVVCRNGRHRRKRLPHVCPILKVLHLPLRDRSYTRTVEVKAGIEYC